METHPEPAVNRPGFGHIAFEVEDVSRIRQTVLEQGGGVIGETVTLTTKTGANVTWCYLTDPEGNILEIQFLLMFSEILFLQKKLKEVLLEI